MKNTILLRYRVDIISVVVVMFSLGVMCTCILARSPIYCAVLILPLVRLTCLVEHNHAHVPIFGHRLLDELFGWLCCFITGIPLELYRVHHVVNHHAFNQEYGERRRDWSSTFGFAGTQFPRVPVGRMYYILTFPILAVCETVVHLLRGRFVGSIVRLVGATVVVGAAIGTLAYGDFLRTLTFVLIPWLVVMFGHGVANYRHHLGCEMTSAVDSANDHLGILRTWLGFNVGYHIEHHMKPGLHWSRLPALHEEIRDVIPANRIKPSSGGT